MHLLKPSSWTIFGLVGLLGAVAWAGPPVEFADGRAMRVEAVEREQTRAVLVLEGGSRLVVPVERVVNWDEIESWRPPPPAPAPARAPARSSASWRLEAGEFAELIDQAARRHDVDPALLTAMAQAESAFNPGAVSPKGAIGLLQLMPQTADRFGVSDPFDPEQNVDGGAEYFSWLLDRFEGREDLALAGYNAGEGAVDRYQGVPPYKETRDYVDRVLSGASRLTRVSP